MPVLVSVPGLSQKLVCFHPWAPDRPVPARPSERADHGFLRQRQEGGDHRRDAFPGPGCAWPGEQVRGHYLHLISVALCHKNKVVI